MDQLAFNFEMTREEEAVHNLLRRGRLNAISVKALEDQTGLPGKEIRQIVRALIMERGVLIASSVSDPPGYYLAETADEIIEATRSLRHRGIMILVRAAKLQKCSLELVFGQARLELETDK